MSIGFFLVYWAFLIGGEDLADRRIVTPIQAMWAPNVLIGISGIYLIRRAVKETTFIRWERFDRIFNVFQKFKIKRIKQDKKIDV